MRLSSIFKLSFVGTLLFSPAMADDAEKVHEEALRVLHEKMAYPGPGQATNAGPSSMTTAPAKSRPADSKDSKDVTDADRARAERESRLNAEARQRMQERDRAQAEKRRQFEEYVKERERLRQQQREFDENVAHQTGQLNPPGNPGASTDEVHSKALEILHQMPAQPPGNTPGAGASGTIQPALQPANHSAVTVPESSSPVSASVSSSTANSPVEATPNEAVQQRALQILHERQVAEASAAANGPHSAMPLHEAEVAPRVVAVSMAQNDSTAETQAKALEVLHQQMQAEAKSAPPVEPVTDTTPQPSPYLQQRLKEMNEELKTPAPKSGATTASQPQTSAQVSSDYIKELEQRAHQNAQEQTRAPAPAATISMPPSATTSHSTATTQPAPAQTSPGLDQRTREMLERQNREISHEMDSSAAVAPSTAPSSASTYSSGLSPDAEAKAREVLHQQQKTVWTAPSASSASTASSPAPTAASSSAPMATTQPRPANTQIVPSATTAPVTAPDTAHAQYSKELEERARQTILERAQAQQTAAARTPTTTPSAASTTPPMAQPSTTSSSTAGIATAPAAPQTSARPSTAPPAMSGPPPSFTPAAPANTEEIHNRALEVLNNPGPKTKQDRLRDLTDLYKADKIGPAEYHQKRAAILAEPK